MSGLLIRLGETLVPFYFYVDKFICEWKTLLCRWFYDNISAFFSFFQTKVNLRLLERVSHHCFCVLHNSVISLMPEFSFIFRLKDLLANKFKTYTIKRVRSMSLWSKRKAFTASASLTSLHTMRPSTLMSTSATSHSTTSTRKTVRNNAFITMFQ